MRHLCTEIVWTVRRAKTQPETAAFLPHQLVLLAVYKHNEGARGRAPRTPRLTVNSTGPQCSKPRIQDASGARTSMSVGGADLDGHTGRASERLFSDN